jgi:hypothetical protein
VLRIGDGSLEVTHGATEAGGTVAGSASDVLLALWGRLPLDDLAIEGDVEPLRRLLAAADFD